MNQRTAQQLGQLAPALVPVARTVTEYYMTQKQLHQQREAQLELVEARAEHTDTRRRRVPAEPAPAPQEPEESTSREPVDGTEEAVERLRERTDCEICDEILQGIGDLPPAEQGVALTEYGRFRGRVEDDAPMDEIRAALSDAPKLKSIMADRFNADFE
jgi:hypothetical protein